MTKQKGTEIRESAEVRIQEQEHTRARLAPSTPKTGKEIFEACLAQGLVAAFSGENFVAYVDQYSKKKVITKLPSLTLALRADFIKAAKAHAEGGKKKTPKVKTPKPEKDARGPADTRVIEVLTEGCKNPWKGGTRRHELWALYSTCKTVGDYYTAGGDSQYIMRDKRRGYISLK